MKGLTIKEPWCSAITFGTKRVENRSWPTAYRGLIALHAGRSIDRDAPEMAWLAASLTFLRDAPLKEWNGRTCLGAILAVAEVTGCHNSDECMIPASQERGVRTGCSEWAARGQWHIEVAQVRPLSEPVPCRGMLSLWRLPEDVEKAVRAQLEVAGG